MEPSQIAEIVDAEIKRRINFLKIIVYPFTALFTILLAIGLSVPDFIWPVMIKIYPPEKIYFAIQEKLIEHKTSKTDDESKVDEKSKVWEAIWLADKSYFEKLANNDDFFISLGRKFDREIVNAFGIPGSGFTGELNNNEELKKEILKLAGGDSKDDYQLAEIRIVRKAEDNVTGKCGRRFKHSSRHVIIHQPIVAGENSYGWLRCNVRYKISIHADGKTIDDVDLVSIEKSTIQQQDQNVGVLELRVSAEVARILDLPNWRTFQSKINGSYKITDVRFE